MLSVRVSDLTEEIPALIKVYVTFSPLMSTISQDYTQTARQATYYVPYLVRNNAFAELNMETVKPFSPTRNIFSRKLQEGTADMPSVNQEFM